VYALPPITAQLASKVLSSVVSAINWKSSGVVLYRFESMAI